MEKIILKSEIFFYLPIEENIPLPEKISDYWDWQIKLKGQPGNSWGRYHWVVQTFLFLKNSGVNCQIVRQLPDEGTVTSHIDYFPRKLKPSRKLFLISMLVDRKFAQNPFSNLYIVHNPLRADSKRFFYMPPWPQVNLIARNENRGMRFENIAYCGNRHEVAKELLSCSFEQKMNSLGFKWSIIEPNQWNDFGEVDAVVAVRDFNCRNIHKNKPALKLINCWKAGVPAVLGCEGAYELIGRKNKDYLEVKSVDEIF